MACCLDDVGVETVLQLQQDRSTTYEESAKIVGFSSRGVTKRVLVLPCLSEYHYPRGSRQWRMTEEVRILDEIAERVMKFETALLQMK